MQIEKSHYESFADPLSVFFEEYLEVTDIRDFVFSGEMDNHFEWFQTMEERRNITKTELRQFLRRKGYERKQKRVGTEVYRGYFGLRLRRFKNDDMPF